MAELQQALLRDDCYLPGVRQEFGRTTMAARLAASHGNPEPLRDGLNRPVAGNAHAWSCAPGDWVAYEFPVATPIQDATLVLDSALDRLIVQNSDEPGPGLLDTVPPAMPKAFHLDVLSDGRWERCVDVRDNYQRLVRLAIGRRVEGIRFVLDETWGGENTQVFAFYL